MLKDYVKRSNYQSHHRLRRGALLIFSIFIIAFVLSLILYHQKLHHIHSQNKTTNSTAMVPKPELPAPAAQQPQFDFYTLLPKMQLPISKSENGE